MLLTATQPIAPTIDILGKTHRVNYGNEIVLNVCPGKEISWKQFLDVSPNNFIALDGLVGAAPLYDPVGRRANFNHHQDVNRLATRSTSGQVFVAIKQGLMDVFRNGSNSKINIYVNDPDQDSSLAVWLLLNYERIIGTRNEPIINKLINAEDLLDTTGGAYPIDPTTSLMRELAWIFEPYVEARMAGRIREMQGSEMANVIDAVGVRISNYTLGKGEKIELDTRYEDIGGGDSWRMIKEYGFYARTGLFARGVKAFVSFLGENNGRYHYSIGKMSPFIPFSIESIYQALNYHEGLDMKSGICWNGSDTIGGSPRRVGSGLSPSEVSKIINQLINNN